MERQGNTSSITLDSCSVPPPVPRGVPKCVVENKRSKGGQGLVLPLTSAPLLPRSLFGDWLVACALGSQNGHDGIDARNEIIFYFLKMQVCLPKKRPSWRKSKAPKKYSRKRWNNRVVSVYSAPTVGLGMGARTVLRTYFHTPITLNAVGFWFGSLKPFSCVDPAGTLDTLQPNMFDQWAKVYEKYLVHKAFVNITITPQGVSTGVINASVDLAGYPSEGGTVVTSINNALAQPYGKHVTVTSGGDCKTLKFSLNPYVLMGLTEPLNWDDFGGITTVAGGTDPGNHAKLQLVAQSSYTTGASNPMTLTIEIVQHVSFRSRLAIVDVV